MDDDDCELVRAPNGEYHPHEQVLWPRTEHRGWMQRSGGHDIVEVVKRAVWVAVGAVTVIVFLYIVGMEL